MLVDIGNFFEEVWYVILCFMLCFFYTLKSLLAVKTQILYLLSLFGLLPRYTSQCKYFSPLTTYFASGGNSIPSAVPQRGYIFYFSFYKGIIPHVKLTVI